MTETLARVLDRAPLPLMKNLLTSLSLAATFSFSACAVEVLLHEASTTRLDFTLLDLETPGMAAASGPEGGVLVAPATTGGFTVLVGWSGLGAEPDLFNLLPPYTPAEVSGFEGTEIREVPGGLRCVYGEPLTVPDSDGDGVPDDQDQCPDSVVTPTVWVGRCDSGVPNRTDEYGCTLADKVNAALARAAAGARNHGRFVSAMVRHLQPLVVAGEITAQEYGALMSCVARTGTKSPH